MSARLLIPLLSLAALLNIGFWFHSSKIYAKWPNIPVPPAERSLKLAFLDDGVFAYRVWGLALQNFGNIGETQPLKNYNYDYLGKWFFLMDGLDPHSNFMPYLAAYYFSATQNPAQLPAVIKYLEMVGKKPEQGKWRWLAQAAYLARHRMNDMDEALRLARELGAIYKPGMPLWTRNMEPMLRADMGDRQAAYLLALEILKSDGAKMSASEYTSTITMICQSILTPGDAAKSPVCQK